VLSAFPGDLLLESFGQEGEDLKRLIYRLYEQTKNIDCCHGDIGYQVFYQMGLNRTISSYNLLRDYADDLLIKLYY